MIAYKSSYDGKEVEIQGNQNRYIKSGELQHILDFLVEQKNNFNICWDIDVFVAPIFKLFTLKQLNELFQNGRIKIDAFMVIYNQGKSFRVSKGYGNYAAYYWIQQYCQEDTEPDLDEMKYIGDLMLQELNRIGVFPTKLTSGVAVFENIFDELNLPTYKDLPTELCQWAWKEKGKAWTEAFKIGHFNMCTDLDINSCFPSIMAELYDTRYGEMVHSKNIPSDAKYVFAKGKLTTSDYITPFVYANKYGNLFSPKGTREAVVTKEGLDYLRDYDAGEFEIEDAYSWIPRRLFQPLKYTTSKLFSNRSANFSKPVKRIFKGALNGIYGRFYQEFRDGTLGKQVNPVWGMLIEDGARLKLAKFIKDNQLEDKLLSVNTDGLLLEGDYPMESSFKMGEWRVDNKGSALIVSSGVVFFADKKPCQIYYPEAMSLIEANPEGVEWHKKASRLMVIGDAVQGFSEELGTVQETSPGFGLIYDHDRYFKDLPRNGKELLGNIYTSEPIDVEVLK